MRSKVSSSYRALTAGKVKYSQEHKSVSRGHKIHVHFSAGLTLLAIPFQCIPLLPDVTRSSLAKFLPLQLASTEFFQVALTTTLSMHRLFCLPQASFPKRVLQSMIFFYFCFSKSKTWIGICFG